MFYLIFTAGALCGGLAVLILMACINAAHARDWAEGSTAPPPERPIGGH